MKRLKWLMVLTFLLILSSTTSFAVGSDFIQIAMNGQVVQVRQVPIYLDGQALESKVPSFIHIDRTLVPIRFVMETYGAEVEWDQSTKTATVLYEDKVISLTIDSPIAKVNDDERVLDKNSIPRLVVFENKDARTMVPLAFISEVLGYEVGYDEVKRVPYMNSKKDVEKPEDEVESPDQTDSRTLVKDISLEKGSSGQYKVVIRSNEKLKYASRILTNNKLVVDIKGAKLDLEDSDLSSINLRDKNINKVEFKQHSEDVVRLTIFMTDMLDYDITSLDDGKTNVISFVNKIDQILLDKMYDRDVIVVEGKDRIQYKTMRLHNPERLVVDLLDASLSKGPYFNFDYQLGPIERVRVSQFQPDNNYSPYDRIVRLVLDLREGTNPNIIIDNVVNKLVIYPEKSLADFVYHSLEGKERILRIKNDESVQYKLTNYPERKTLEVRLPYVATEIVEGQMYIKDGLVEEIIAFREDQDMVIEIKYNKSILYESLSNTWAGDIILKLERNSDIKPWERLIVIDPGHGGSDPGAKSVNGRFEKDLNFSIGLKLNEALKAKGYNTLMTRERDEFIDLYDRAGIANENYADIFISIHGNSVGNNTSVKGLEVYYCSENKTHIEDELYPLAKSIYDELIKATGAKERGVKTARYVVIRETLMPSVLIETGFLSSPEEEALLYSEEYQDKIVEGIVKGVERYFEIY